MRLNFLSFSNLTLLVALSLSSVAAWYSIIGLTAIFAGAVIPVIIMGSILEIGKITTTVWLRKYWSRAGWLLKLYLVPAVIALALLTSMGIFGFLSKAHMDQGITSGDVQAKLNLYDEKIKIAKENIDVNRKGLKQLDDAVDQVMGRSSDEKGADKAVSIRRSQSKERARFLADIEAEQKIITSLNEERAPIAAEVRKVEAEVGPIKYIAALIYGDNADQNMLESAVRWVIILLVVVFDPLAIALVLAANASKEWDIKDEVSTVSTVIPDETDTDPETVKESLPPNWPFPSYTTPSYEQDDGALTEEQMEQIKEHVSNLEVTMEEEEAFKLMEPEVSDSTLNCYICGTELINAPGIGPFCPNKNCDVKDDIFDESKWTDISPILESKEPIVEKTLAELHPYLHKGFPHFENTKPIVAKEEPIEDVEPKEEPIIEDNEVLVAQDKLYTELEGGYVIFEDKHYQIDSLKSLRPDIFMLTADSQRSISTNFGIKFPDVANKGDVFVRVDSLPNRVYKYDGNKWIEIQKDQSDTYLHNQKYVKYLIEKIEKGEYDLDLLSETEKEQIELYLKNQNI